MGSLKINIACLVLKNLPSFFRDRERVASSVFSRKKHNLLHNMIRLLAFTSAAERWRNSVSHAASDVIIAAHQLERGARRPPRDRG